jgi:hypothetical protein
MPERVIIDANALAAWLAREVADVLWTVDGENHLEAQLDLPCTGSALATAVRKHGGELLVLVPHHGSLGTSERDPGALAMEDEHGARVFQLAWKSEPDHRWVVVEDVADVELERSKRVVDRAIARPAQ